MKPQISWLRVFVEGVVIVGSILLAFGLQAWWEGKQEREDLRAALAEMVQDLVADSLDQEAGRGTAHQYEEAALWALRNHGNSRIPVDSAAIVLEAMYLQNPYQPVRAAYIGLRDSGGLDLISDDALRNAIIAYYETEQGLHVWRTEEMLALARGFWEAAELDLHLAPTDDLTSFEGRRIELARPWSEIPTDARFFPRLRSLGSRAARSEELTVGLLRTNRQLQQLIREALDQSR